MTVEQNIAFGLKQDRLPKAEITARVQEMLALVHMQEFANVSRTNSQAASGSASRWRAAWRNGPSCCCLMNRWGAG